VSISNISYARAEYRVPGGLLTRAALISLAAGRIPERSGSGLPPRAGAYCSMRDAVCHFESAQMPQFAPTK
jgi:hypothetical protein